MLKRLIYNDLKTIYGFKKPMDESLKEYRSIMSKCRLDWESYDVYIDANSN